MVRKTIRYQLIQNESTRKLTYKKRKAGMLKKLKEITTLCGVEGFAIVYNNFNDQPDIWPPSPAELIQKLNQFMDLPDNKREKYALDQVEFLQQKIGKLKKMVEKVKESNERKEMEVLFDELLVGEKRVDEVGDDVEGLKEIEGLIDEKLRAVDERIAELGM